jgi:hypothetical protein
LERIQIREKVKWKQVKCLHHTYPRRYFNHSICIILYFGIIDILGRIIFWDHWYFNLFFLQNWYFNHSMHCSFILKIIQLIKIKKRLKIHHIQKKYNFDQKNMCDLNNWFVTQYKKHGLWGKRVQFTIYKLLINLISVLNNNTISHVIYDLYCLCIGYILYIGNYHIF